MRIWRDLKQLVAQADDLLKTSLQGVKHTLTQQRSFV
jgi:hypothetical protein